MNDWLAILGQAELAFDRKELDNAQRLARQVLEQQPESARARQVLGLTLSERYQVGEAIVELQKALALQPDLVAAHNGLGLCHFQRDELDKALDHFNKALILDPTHVHAHFNRSVIWLKTGRYEEGWVEYEWRWNAGLVAKTNIPRPRWDGSPLDGRSLLILTEQGLGDVLQFIRLLPLVKARGGRIVFACQKALQRLLSRLPWIDDWFPIDQAAPINFDLQVPLLSLPAVLGIHEQNLPCEVPYLVPDPERIQRWGERVRELPGLKVGLCWQGSRTFRGDGNRSIPLRHFTALRTVPGLSLVSLQKGPGVEQIESHQADLGLTVYDDLDAEGTFLDTAALMAHLDLVITSDTAVAHLAGALGRPTWVLLGTGADWRWQLERRDSPWYPTMRLFRQRSEGDWSGVFADVAAELRRVQAREASLPIGADLVGLSAFHSLEPDTDLLMEATMSTPATPIPEADSTKQELSHPLGELTSVHTSNFPDLLRHLNITLAISTYQAGRLIFLRPEAEFLNTHFRSFDRPMGLAYHDGHLAIGCGLQVWEFFNVPLVAPKLPPEGTHDACFLPRRTHFTGDIDIHEMAFAPDGTLWFVNTRFCCLCTLDLHSSFVPRWRPKFISRLAPEDRCHLNGLALVDGLPRYATALGTTDVAGGWRQHKARGGVLLDVPENRVLIEGLSMPHSPRWYRDRLWLLESGDGSLGWVDLAAMKYHKICDLPGFTRGLDFVGPLAFIGLSQVRESAIFSGIPLGERLKERLCGVYVVNIETGSVVAFLHFTGGVQEVFAVQVLAGLRYPELINESNDWLRHSYVLPDEALA